MASEGSGVNVNLNVHLRTDAPPEQLVKELLLSPLIYIRLVGILCSIIVFGCVANQVSNIPVPNSPFTTCGYNGNSDACNFAIAVGVLGFLLCLAFLVKDVLYVIVDYSNNIVVKKVILLVDAVTNGLWAFMWFVCFCFTANQLAINSSRGVILPGSILNCANSGAAFSFFCILIWVAIVVVNVFYFVRIIRGTDASNKGQSGYASFPEGSSSDQPYQGDEGDKQYAPPEY